MEVGRIHSFESMGLFDGPGIRCVVFMQGYALKFAYCHNPDTWTFSGGTKMTSQELFKKIIRSFRFNISSVHFDYEGYTTLEYKN